MHPYELQCPSGKKIFEDIVGRVLRAYGYYKVLGLGIAIAQNVVQMKLAAIEQTVIYTARIHVDLDGHKRSVVGARVHFARLKR